jgi:O-antigen ligase
MELLYISLAILVLVLHVLSVIFFKRAFYLYLFLFVPCYGLFLDLCSRITPLAANTVITATKDYVWIFILLGFFVHQLIKPYTCRFPTAMAMWLLLYILYGLSTISMSMSNIGFTGLALGVRNAFMYIPAAFIAACLISNGKDILALIYRFRFMMIVIGLYTIIQITFGIESSFNVLRDRADLKNAVTSTFLSYIELSYFACMCFALLIAGFKWLRGKALTVVGLGLAVFCIVMSQSRTGLIVLALLLIPFAFKKSRLFAGTLFIASAVIMLLVISNPELFYAHRLYKDAFATSRIIDWMSVFPWFFEHPIFGYGLGSFGPAAFKAVQMGWASVSKAYYMDSFFLTTLLNTGLTGLCLFLLLLVNVFGYIRKTGKNTSVRETKDLISGIKVLLLINLFYSLFFNMIDGFPGSLYFWFFAGVVCAIGSQKQNVAARCKDGSVVAVPGRVCRM